MLMKLETRCYLPKHQGSKKLKMRKSKDWDADVSVRKNREVKHKVESML